MKPIIAKSKHHVRNSLQFAASIAHELLETGEQWSHSMLYLYSQEFQFNRHLKT